MAQSQLTRKNHYVPIWYQRRFLSTGQSSLCLLNLEPPAPTSVGKVSESRKPSISPPKSCFYEVDLYTTVFGASLNDEIERYLFGKIDNAGASAVKAFADNNLREIYDSFENFFEFLDAQKLRTPKGLDWIKSNYPGLTQTELMI